MQEERSLKTALLYLKRALFLQCPTCGTKPIFLPLSVTRNMHDWFAPLDGCPRCGYPYEREPGYFLMSIWAINYGFGAVFAVALYGIYEWFFAWSILKLLMATIIPLALFNFAFARHSKAIFLAFDLFCDPHEKKGGGDDGGNRLAVPPLDGNSPQRGAPLPASPEPPVLVGLRKDS